MPGVVVHTCDPSTERWRLEDQEFKPSLHAHKTLSPNENSNAKTAYEKLRISPKVTAGGAEGWRQADSVAKVLKTP